MIEVPNPLPSELTLDVYLYHTTSKYTGPSLEVDELELSSTESFQRIYLAKGKVTFQIEDVDIPGIQIESLKKIKQQVLAEAQAQANRIDEQIQSLMAIEHKPEVQS